MNAEIRFPQLRLDLISAIDFLAESDVNHHVAGYDSAGKVTSYIDFDLSVHILFDDIHDLQTNSYNLIGSILRNESEASIISKLTVELDKVIDEDYPDDLDEAYVKTPQWQRVVKLAKEARSIFHT